MGLLGLRRKPWKDADPKKRLAGVMEVPRTDQGTLFHLASQDQDQAVRLAAARRIKSVSYLERLLAGSDESVSQVARQRLAGVAVAEIKQRPLDQAKGLLAEVNEQSSLTEIVLQASDHQVRQAALERFCNLDDASPSLLARIVIQVEDETQAQTALAKIDRRQQLKDISKKAKLDSIKQAAAEKLDVIVADAQKPSAEKQRRQRRKAFDALLKETQALTATTHPEDAVERLERINNDWQSTVAEFESVAIEEESQSRIDQFARLNEKVQERLAELAAEAEAHRALEACCEKWEARRQELGDHVDQATLDNLADAALAEWEQLAGHEGAVSARFKAIFQVHYDAVAVQAAVDAGEAVTEETAQAVQLNAADQLRVEAILEEAQGLIDQEEWREADYRYKELHKEWSGITVDLPFEHPYRKGFHDAYVAFKNKCYERREERRQLQESNIKVLEGLVQEMKALSEEKPVGEACKQHFDNLRSLQDKWKQVKPVSFKASAGLRKEFKRLSDIAYAPLRAHREEQEWKSFSNIGVAEEIIERAKELFDADPEESTLDAIKSLQQEWKDMGRLPRERQEELWLAFKAACDQVFELLQPLFEERDKERMAHYEQKQVLIEELTELCDEDVNAESGPEGKEARKQRVEKVKALQAKWKEIGPVPRDRDKDQWNHYKKLLDSFFGRRRQEFEHIAADQTENLHQKLALIAEAEELAEMAEASKDGSGEKINEPDLLRKIKAVQSSWKQVGFIPKDKVEETWEKFRGYCDRVYACLADWFAAMDVERKENLKLKLAVLDKIEAYTKEEDPTSFREEVKALQAEWRDIGYIPRESMDEVMTRYQDLCNIIFNVKAEAAPVVSDADAASGVVHSFESGVPSAPEETVVSDEQAAQEPESAADTAEATDASDESNENSEAANPAE